MDTVCEGYHGGKESLWKIEPLILFLVKDIIDDKLDLRQFPSVGGQRNIGANYAAQR